MLGFFCIELKSRRNHPTLDELYHLNLDDSVSHWKVEVLYNPLSLAMYLKVTNYMMAEVCPLCF